MAKSKKFWKATGIYLIILNFILLVIFSGFIIDKKISSRQVQDSILEISYSQSEIETEEIVIGAEIAPLTIIVYNDYESAYCKKFDKKIYEKLKQEYVDTGLVNVVVRDFSLSRIHKNSVLASQAVKCAGEQDMAKEMHEVILDNKNPTQENLKFWAKDLGIDNSSFCECLDSQKYLEKIKEDSLQAQKAQVTVVPTFFIGEQKLEGVQPYFVMRKSIESELEKLNQ